MQISTVLRLTGRKLNHHRTTSSQRFHSFICNSIDFLFHPLLSIPLQFPKYNTTVSLTPFSIFWKNKNNIRLNFVENKGDSYHVRLLSRFFPLFHSNFSSPPVPLLFSNRAKTSSQATQTATEILIERALDARCSSRGIVACVEFTASLVV